jgi:hypothetical protein
MNGSASVFPQAATTWYIDNDGDGYGHIEDEGNENENNLINRIGNFIDKHTPKNWDVNVHKDINPK